MRAIYPLTRLMPYAIVVLMAVIEELITVLRLVVIMELIVVVFLVVIKELITFVHGLF